MEHIATLDIGVVTLTVDGTARDAACSGGFLTVEGGRVRLIATSFEYAEDSDKARAEQAKALAERILADSKEEKDIALAKMRLARALNRLKIASNTIIPLKVDTFVPKGTKSVSYEFLRPFGL